MSHHQRVRGTRDLLPLDNQLYRFVEESAHQISKNYGYGEIDTPIFEFSEVFHRTLGETSDVIHKETYTFTDRGGESLTLRPEGTAGVARAFVSEGMAQNIPLKLYYQGPMFRYERPQKGRYRQFHQLGVEFIGLDTPMADIETISMGYALLQKIGLAPKCTLEINTLGDMESRTKYREALINYFTEFKEQLSTDSKMRLEKNPLRILDSKDPEDKKISANAPKFENFLNETSKNFFATVCAGLKKLEIPYNLNPHLVRGLDYYNHTVFEFVTTELGAQGTVLAGGRYDGLIQMMGGPQVTGVGWAAGIERLSELVDKELIPSEGTKVALIPADEIGESEALVIANSLRAQNFICEIIWKGNVGKKMQKANKWGAHFAVIMGQTEVENNSVTLKNLKSGAQALVKAIDLFENLK